MFLAREAGVDVVAVDLWVTAAEVQGVIDAAEVADRVTPLQADVRQLPLRDEEFDAIVSIDAFEYFGTDVHLLPDLLPVLRPGGTIAMTTPTLSVDPYVQTPPAEVTALVGWDAAAWHAPGWWQRHWEADAGPLLTMLTVMAPDRIGIARSSAQPRPSPVHFSVRPVPVVLRLSGPAVRDEARMVGHCPAPAAAVGDKP